MKYFILTLSIVLSQFARSEVLEVNKTDNTVYYYPNPTLQLDFEDVGDEKTLVLVSLDYSTDSLQQEIDILKKQYPNMKFERTSSSNNGNMILNIDDFVHEEIKEQDGQYGPYVNTSLTLNAEQTKKLRALGNSVADKVDAHAAIAVDYLSTTSLEKYVAGPEICASMKVRSVKDLITQPAIKRPSGIQYDETYNDLQRNALMNCFSVAPTSIGSFGELMKLVLSPNPKASIVGEYTELSSQKKTLSIRPNIKVVE